MYLHVDPLYTFCKQYLLIKMYNYVALNAIVLTVLTFMPSLSHSLSLPLPLSL